jgi:RimJ/RimL family protein N-acetyltransferase
VHAIAYAFNTLKADELFAIVRPAHQVSIRVLEKCGMQLFGTLDDVAGEAESLVYKMSRG